MSSAGRCSGADSSRRQTLSRLGGPLPLLPDHEFLNLGNETVPNVNTNAYSVNCGELRQSNLQSNTQVPQGKLILGSPQPGSVRWDRVASWN
eukprot:COSAG02_NODE_2668_length_8293_cov_23.094825_6_plen_92_part_00